METDLVVVSRFLTRVEADLAATALAAADIPALVRSDDCGGLRPHFWMGGVDLLVRAGDVHRAAEVLETAAKVDEPGPPE